MALSIAEALAQPGSLIAAWDWSADDNQWLGVYAASERGVTLLAHERMDSDRRKRLTAELTGRGVRVGGTYGGKEYVWGGDTTSFGVWGLDARVLEASRTEVIVEGATVPVDAIRAVVSFLDAGDLGHRGVRIELTGGGPILVAEERDPMAAADPTYDRSNVALDGAWASFLGRDLARWLGTPHEDQLP